jgi:hypothetical protein
MGIHRNLKVDRMLSAEPRNRAERRASASIERGHDAKHGWRVAEWASAAGCSRSFVYNLLAAKQLESVKLGRSRVIITHPRDYLAALHDEGAR